MSSFAYNRRARLVATVGRSPALRHALVALFAVLLGLAGGAAVAFGPFWAAFVALAALACGYAMLVNTRVGLAAVFFLITVLPFGTLPFKAVVTPSFLELALIALMAVWLLQLLSRPEEPLILTPLGLSLLGFLGLTLFSFLIGSNGSPDSLTLHNYFKFLLAVLFFFSVVNCVRTREQAVWALRFIMIGGALSALIGLILYLMRDTTAQQILVSFGRIGYPTTGRVLRYVEDDPTGIERAIGLSVDPNSFGGMLALVGALTATQAAAERPALPRPLLVLMAAVMALTVLLTASRAAIGGLFVGTVYAAALRYRKLCWPIVGAALLAALLYFGFGIGARFVDRFTQGAQFRDQANLMRLNEYRNAVEIIGRYPIFGIGFAQAPDIDLGAGVSSIYLALAERIGLVGLFGFLGIVVAFFIRVWRGLRVALARADLELAGWSIGLQAGIVAALAVGMLDHYFFNIEFSHMVALFWGGIGLALSLTNGQRPMTNDERDDTSVVGRRGMIYRARSVVGSEEEQWFRKNQPR